MYLGSFAIDDYLGIPAATHRFSSGVAYAPTSLTYSIYEEATTTGIDEDVDMVVASPFDGIVGCYWVRRQLTTAAGFEAGKNYLVVIKATVDSVVAIQMHTFQVAAKVDTRYVGGTLQTAKDLGDSIGTPVALDGGTATLAGMLTKLADDNNGVSYDATTDSQRAMTAGILTTALTESYAAKGAAPTLTQAIYMILQLLTEFVITAGSSTATYTVKKLDQAATAFTLVLNDPASPTGSSRNT